MFLLYWYSCSGGRNGGSNFLLTFVLVFAFAWVLKFLFLRGRKVGCTFVLVLVFSFVFVFAFVCVRVLKLLFFTRKKGWLYLSISDSAICQTHLLQPLTMASILNTECDHWTLKILTLTYYGYHFLFILKITRTVAG